MAGRAQITVQQLRGAITTLSNGFDRLNSSVSPAATSTKMLAKSFQTLNTALGEIKKYAIELNTALDSIVPQGGKGNIKFKPNLFSAFNTVIESINNSVDANALKEFQTRANSMRSFVLSLKDMVSINKNFGEVTGLLNKMNTPATKGGTDSPLQSIIDMINSLGAISSRTQVYGSNTNGSTTLKNIINPKIQGIRDVIKLLSDIVPTLKTFVDDKIEPARQALTSVEYPIKSFVTSLSGIVDRIISETTKTDASGTSTKKPVSLINPKIQGIRDIAKTIQMVAQDIVPMAEKDVSTAAGKLKDIYPKIIEFITQLSAISSRGEKDITDKSDNKKTISILNKNVQGVRDISKTISILSTDLATLADEKIKTAIANLQKLREPLWYFISQIGNLAPRQSDQNKKGELIHVLNSKLQGIRDIGRTIKVFATDFKELNIDISNAIKNLNDLKQPLTEFITQVGQLGVRGKGQQGTGKKKKNISTLNASLQGIRDIARTIKIVVEDLKGLSNISGVINQLGQIKDELIKFISGFTISDKTAKLNFDYGREVLDKIANVFKKYSKIVSDLNSVGSANVENLAEKFKTFIEEISKAVNNRNLTNINTDNVKNLGKVAQGFKTVFNLLSSVSSGKFANFTTEINKAIPNLETFIDRMASLSTRSTFPDFERVANSLSHFNGRFKETSAITEHASKSMTKFRSILRQIYTAFVGGAVIYSIVRSIKSAVKEIFNLEYAMARVNTIARVSSNELNNMTHFVQDISASYGIASEKVSKALYDINSATIKGVSSLKILEQSAKLAVAGFTDIDKVTNLIARAVNAYEYSVSEAAKISDILFVTVERGINPMEELSEYMGRLFTVSANAGVSLEEVGAGLATLTARGYQTNVASTALNSAILKLSTGTKELNKLFNQYGYASSASALRTIGLTGALQVLYKATNGATEKLHDLGFNYRDIRAATTLASGAIDEYNKTLALMNDETYKAGLTNKAYSEAQDTVIFKFNKLKETYTVLIQTIAEYLNKNQTLKKFLEVLTNGIENVTESLRGSSLSLKDEIGSGLSTVVPKFVALYGVLNLLSKPIISIKDSFVSASKAGKGFSGVLAGMKSGASWMLPAMYATTELSTIGSWISQINKAGTWGSGFKNVFNGGFLNTWGNLGAVALGGLGNVLDTALLGSTDFGSRLYNYYNRANYVDEDAVKKSKSYQGAFNLSAFNTSVAESIKSIKNLDLVANNLSEDKINEVYNKAIDEIQQEARFRNISKEQLETAIKVTSEQRDLLLSYNNVLKKLLPNTQALDDVFESACKNIDDAVEKFASPLEKQLNKMQEAEDAISVLVRETGFSEEQLKAAGSSSEGMRNIKEMWTKQQDAINKNLAEYIKTQQVDISSIYSKQFSQAKDEMKRNYDTLSDFITNDIGLPKEFISDVLANRNSNDFSIKGEGYKYNITGLASNKEFQKMYSEYEESLTNLKKLETMSKFDKASLGINDYMSKISMFFSEDEYKALMTRKDDVIKIFSDIPDNIKNDAEKSTQFIAKALRDVLANPEIGKAFDVLGRSYLEVIHDTDKYRKTITALGVDITKIQAQFKTVDIFSMFNLASVQDITQGLKNKLYKPEDIKKVTDVMVNNFMRIAAEGIAKNQAKPDLINSIVEAFRQDDALQNLNEEELKKKANQVIAATSTATSFIKNFVSQFSEMDYLNTMNKLKYGSELSTFKKYKEVGKTLIENLSKSMIEGYSFSDIISVFEKNRKDFGFNEAILKLKDMVGENGVITFLSYYSDLVKYTNEFISPLNTEFRNLKKRGLDFVKNYRDSLLSPIEQFQKTEALLNRRLANIREQSKNGRLNPESIKNAMDTIDKLYKLNEETMNLKVPASITASEFVRSGSKEAFDLVARNVFKDTYKVNVRQEKLQEKLVKASERLVILATQGSKNVSESVTYP